MDPDQLVYLDLHCFQLSLYMYLVSYYAVRAMLNSLCIICSLGQVNVSLDKCSMAVGKCKICYMYFHTPDLMLNDNQQDLGFPYYFLL